MKIKRNNVLMLYPSVMEIEQKSDMNPFWKAEWERVKADIGDFKAFIEYIYEIK